MMNTENTVQPVTDRTIHNEVNFKPEDYEVLDYLDNQPPRWEVFAPGFGEGDKAYENARVQHEAARKHWTDTMDYYFPHRHDAQPSIHKCTHCGNVNVRYIVAVKHKPTGQNVVFGDICVARLGFANQSEFKAAQLRAQAEAGNKRMAAYRARVKFLEEHPALAAVVNNKEELNHPDHANNEFARDIIAKFNQYGSLSERQIECLLQSLTRDHEYAARRAAEAAKPKGPVPTGRVEFTCSVISTREQESDFGIVTKMLVELDNNSRIWLTMPSAIGAIPNRGDRFRLKATVEASKDDVSFGFGKRPMLLETLTTTKGAQS